MSFSEPICLVYQSEGQGHYQRISQIQSQLQDAAPNSEIILKSISNVDELSRLMDESNYRNYVIDVREIPQKAVKNAKRENKIIIAFDATGGVCSHLHYNINTLVLKKHWLVANLSGYEYFPVQLKPTKSKKVNSAKSIQICVYLPWLKSTREQSLLKNKLRAFLKRKKISCHRIVFVNTKVFINDFQHVTHDYLEKDPFENELAQSDLFISHFGISCFEALKLGTVPYTWNPSLYHQRLSQNHFADIIKWTENEKSFEALKPIFGQYDALGNNFNKIGLMIKELFHYPHKGLGAESRKQKIIYRKPEANFYPLSSRHSFVQDRLMDPDIIPEMATIRYNDQYFLDDYLKSYGKTYEEDRENIYRLSDARLKVIKKYKPSGKLMDVGAAMGFFLDRAKTMAYETMGIEISSFAANYAAKSHTIFKEDLFEVELKEKVDVLSLWYVVEHFDDLKALLKKLDSFLKPGGVLAFSTPNGAGISQRLKRNNFIHNSPQDHYTILDKASLKKLLEPLAYKFLKTRSSGIHPQRFYNNLPAICKLIPEKWYRFIAQKTNLGDTFEIYFKKKI